MIRNLFYHLYIFLNYRSNYKMFIDEANLIKFNQNKKLAYNIEIQKERLYNLLDFSIKNIPYYKKLANERKIIISNDSIFEDIKKFPILTKDLIRKNWNQLHPKKKKRKLLINTSGGTTGEPIKIIQDQDYRIKEFASIITFDEIGGYKLGEKLIRLWGNEKEIFNETKHYYSFIINTLFRNQIILNSFKMSEKIMIDYIKMINHFKPKVIIAYVQSIYELAKYAKRINATLCSIDSIITSAGVLTNDIKNFLEMVFKCKVYNRYGSREVGIIASSCYHSDKLHINMYQQYIEILNETSQVVNQGERGDIIITNLINYSMPLIRYKVGDEGSLNDSSCPCGRGLLRLDNIFGRIVDIFKTINGELIDGEYFTHLFYFKDNVEKFQIIQEKINEIVVLIKTVNKNPLNANDEVDLTRKIRLVMGESCQVKYEYVSNIKPSSSGKFRYTISKI